MLVRAKQLLEIGKKEGTLTEKSLREWIKFLVKLNLNEEAKTVCSEAITVHKNSSILWNLYWDLSLKFKDSSQSTEDLAIHFFKQIQNNSHLEETKVNLLFYLLTYSANFDKFLELYKVFSILC